jgi:CRP/FNR family transcriptional regulator, dissimilatory nitrate respiration regulator
LKAQPAVTILDSPQFPESLRPLAIRVLYPAGSTIFRTGSPTHSVFFVETGSVRLTRRGRAGEEIILHEARAREFFAEASLDSARYHCDAIAKQATQLIKIRGTELRRLLSVDREFSREWIDLLARQLRASRARIERLCLKSAADRILHLLMSEGRGPHHEVALTGTLKDLAREIGISHEALYRTLASLQRRSIIERQDKVLRLAR